MLPCNRGRASHSPSSRPCSSSTDMQAARMYLFEEARMQNVFVWGGKLYLLEVGGRVMLVSFERFGIFAQTPKIAQNVHLLHASIKCTHPQNICETFTFSILLPFASLTYVRYSCSSSRKISFVNSIFLFFFFESLFLLSIKSQSFSQ